MNSARVLADALTLTRGLSGALLVWLGWSSGALPWALATLVFAWSADILDGAVARCGANPRRSWVGENDLLFDVWVAVGVSGYLTLVGYVPLLVGGSYLVIAWLPAAYLQSKALAEAAQAVPYASLVLIGLRDAPLYGMLTLVWIGLAVVITWPRFPRRQVPEFIGGMRELLGDRRRPR
jgi:phosphatidylglycerophosphate synthase